MTTLHINREFDIDINFNFVPYIYKDSTYLWSVRRSLPKRAWTVSSFGVYMDLRRPRSWPARSADLQILPMCRVQVVPAISEGGCRHTGYSWHVTTIQAGGGVSRREVVGYPGWDIGMCMGRSLRWKWWLMVSTENRKLSWCQNRRQWWHPVQGLTASWEIRTIEFVLPIIRSHI